LHPHAVTARLTARPPAPPASAQADALAYAARALPKGSVFQQRSAVSAGAAADTRPDYDFSSVAGFVSARDAHAASARDCGVEGAGGEMATSSCGGGGHASLAALAAYGDDSEEEGT